jgi:hypothetical protein
MLKFNYIFRIYKGPGWFDLALLYAMSFHAEGTVILFLFNQDLH